MSRPLAVVVGFIGKLPLAGMALYNLHHIAGLHALGFDVHYVERLNKPDECYDPRSNRMADNPEYALSFLASCLPAFDVSGARFSFIDRAGVCHGSGWDGLNSALRRADFILALSDPTWFDELALCPRRAFVDGDPLFTQVAMLDPTTSTASALQHYDTLFTYGVRMGLPDCTIPAAGRVWFPVRPVVATERWKPASKAGQSAVSSLMNWSSGSEVHYRGRTYGYKGQEFERFLALPERSTVPFVVAAGGPAPRERLRDHGWRLLNPLSITGQIEDYQAFIAGSYADLGVAKHAYVASRSGWFSDRSTCYLAAGRPVLHQETGFSNWLPTGEGVFAFSTMDDVLAALEELDADYDRHAKAARRIAEEHFEASTVIGRMLDQAGFR